MGLLSPGERVEDQTGFEILFKNGKYTLLYFRFCLMTGARLSSHNKPCTAFISGLKLQHRSFIVKYFPMLKCWVFFLLFLVWADNADACAKQYAGTGALKTDYTR